MIGTLNLYGYSVLIPRSPVSPELYELAREAYDLCSQLNGMTKHSRHYAN